MRIFRLEPDTAGLVDWPTLSTSKKSVVTVGAFDGTHKGHQAVIARTVELARRERAFSVVVMFDPRPAFVHAWAHAHDGEDVPAGVVDADAISSMDERLRVMDSLGVDVVIVVHYTLAFAAKSYLFFIGQLVGKLGMRTLVLGADARMGAGRKGKVEQIANLAAASGVFELVVVDDQGNGHVRVPMPILAEAPEGRGEPADPQEGMSKAERRAWSKRHNAKEVRTWSSTNLRYLLAHGRVRAAKEILGSAHGVEGTVVHGEERGRTIGFPTANVEEPFEGYLPVDGVYAGWLVDLGPADSYDDSQRHHHDDGQEQQPDGKPMSRAYDDGGAQARSAGHSPLRWPAAISIGTKPTFSETTGRNARVLEAYALTDDWLDLYGHRVRVEFEEFLRPQIKYDSADELKAELSRNVEQTRRMADLP